MGFPYRQQTQIACKILDFCIPILGNPPIHTPSDPRTAGPRAHHGRRATQQTRTAWAGSSERAARPAACHGGLSRGGARGRACHGCHGGCGPWEGHGLA
eukprot:4553065-Prymnesium_polylepis.1